MTSIDTGKKQHYKNLTMNILAFGVQFIISFYISPKIVGQIGAAAYGFIGLANDFVSYASIVATVFNSVASRFIAEEFYKKNFDRANKYFNSLIVANIIISTFLAIISICVVSNLSSIINIPVELVFDVKLSFTLIFLSYIITLLTMVFTTATFVSNRTDINGFRNIIQYIIRFLLIIFFLNFVSVKIYWVALAVLVSSTAVALFNIRLTKKLTPELNIDLKKANKEYAIILAKAGSWMAITSISTILLRGLDLTVANVFIGDYEMGLLSIARTIPNNVTSIINTIAPLFTPVFILCYSHNDIEGLVKKLKESINSLAIILFVPITGFIVFSSDFYSLWQKSLSTAEIEMISILSILTIVQGYFNATTATMAQMSVVANKLKLPVIVTFICGIVSIVAELVMIKAFDLGLYAIVISTTVVMVLRYVLFNSVYAAYCLKIKAFPLIKASVKSWLTIPVLLGLMNLVRRLIPIHNWISLIVDALVCAFVGYLFMIIIFKREWINKIINRVFKL